MQVFVSRPTWIRPEFDAGLKTFLILLKSHGLTPRTLGASDYPSKVPLDEVIEIMNGCSGAIVLGYPQIVMQAGNIKDTDVDSEKVFPTEWNHIEGALAYSKGLPLLVIHDKAISRGIFDRGVMNAYLHSCDFSDSTWCTSESLQGAFSRWKTNCTEGKPNFLVAAKVNPNLHACPNCTTTGKPIYMSKVPPDFAEMGTWHCSRCNYME